MIKFYLITLFFCLALIGNSLAQAPVISSFSPTSGPVGTTITITGSNFDAATGNDVVYFGGVKATVSSATATSLKVVVPAGSTYQPISVLNTSSGLQSYSQSPFQLTFNESEQKNFTAKSFSTATINDPHSGFEVYFQLADIDGDGKLDLAIVNTFDQTLNLYRNTSTTGTLTSGSFTLSATFYVPNTILTYTPFDIKFGDLDGDGKLDMVVPYADQNMIAVYRNTSTKGVINNQSFASQVDFATSSSPEGVTISDLNGDGKPEIIVANHSSSSVSIFKNTTSKGVINSSSFATKQDIATGLIPTVVQAGDLDGDGKPDLLVGTDDGFSIMKNNTVAGQSFSFNNSDVILTAGNSYKAYMADMDGDNKKDILIIAPDKNDILAYKNTTAGGGSTISLGAPVTIKTQGALSALAIADINGDTKPDIVIAPNTGLFSIIPNASAGSLQFGSEVITPVIGNSVNTVAVGDIDGDGKNDIVGSDIVLFHNNIVGLPVISSFTPTSAQTGQTVTITGKNFTGATAVAFGGTNAASFNVVSATSITAVVGSGATGSISVTTADGTGSIAGFNYVLTPVITSSGTLTALSTVQGTASSSIHFSVAGTNMTTGITVTAPAGFEVSTDNSTFSSTTTAGISGTIPSTLVYVRLAASAIAGSYSGNIVLSSAGAVSVNVATVSSTVQPPPQGIFTGPLAGNISVCEGTASTSPNIEQFVISGAGLTGNITATAPAGFEISLSAGSGYINTLIINQTGGKVNNTTIYVRAASTATAGVLSDNIVLTSAGSKTVNVAVSAVVNRLAAANNTSDQTVATGTPTAAIKLAGNANIFNWVNDTPGIGLAASGTGDIPSFTPVNNTNLPIKATITVTGKLSGPVGYITHENNGIVSVLNLTTGAITANIPVGALPTGVAVSPDGSTVYVTNENSASVSVISTATNTVTATIPVGHAPFAVVVSRDGSRAYVAQQFANAVAVINTATNTVISNIPVGGMPVGLCLSPDGTRLYTTNNLSGDVSVINTATSTVIATVPVGKGLIGICITPDGSKLYVESQTDERIYVFDTSTNSLITKIYFLDYPKGMLLMSSDGSRLYVTDGQLLTISTTTNRVIASLKVGNGPVGISANADWSRLYITNNQDNTVSVVDPATNTVTNTMTVAPVVPFYGVGSWGNFVTTNQGCDGPPVKFTITVNPKNLVLPATNFKLTITSATCKGSSNGSINITADQALDYTATITGKSLNESYPFTNSIDINNLSAGTYHVCITVAGQSNFQQCYDAVITEPKDLSVYSTVNNVNNTITLALNGAAQYNVELNGKQYTTSDNLITLPLVKGTNDLTVTTDKLCQGVIQKLINISGVLAPYPNPFQNTLDLNIGDKNVNNVAVQIQNVTDGRTVYSKQFANQSGVIRLELSYLMEGNYILQLDMDNSLNVFKILKK